MGAPFERAPGVVSAVPPAAENTPSQDRTETAISGPRDDLPLSESTNDADRCPHDAPMMPPAYAGDDLGDVFAEIEHLLQEDRHATAGWRLESKGARMQRGVMVKRFGWRRGARGNRQTWTDKYTPYEKLSTEEQQKHERNRAKYTNHRARIEQQ